jgi:hypothetical protein
MYLKTPAGKTSHRIAVVDKESWTSRRASVRRRWLRADVCFGKSDLPRFWIACRHFDSEQRHACQRKRRPARTSKPSAEESLRLLQSCIGFEGGGVEAILRPPQLECLVTAAAGGAQRTTAMVPPYNANTPPEYGVGSTARTEGKHYHHVGNMHCHRGGQKIMYAPSRRQCLRRSLTPNSPPERA